MLSDSKRRPDWNGRFDAVMRGLAIVPYDAQQAEFAREANARCGRTHPAKLNFGDRMVYGLAQATGESLPLQGDDFAQTDVIPAFP